jgi:hypothetical protein
MKKFAPALLLVLLCAAPGQAADFGLLLTEAFLADGANKTDTTLAWTQTASPWFSFMPNERFSVYLSLDLSLEYADTTDSNAFTDSDKWQPLFQVGRSQLLWNAAPNLFVEAGRMFYEDPLGYIASGLFDGARASLNLGQNTLGFSWLYTGLQYKERAKIVMTAGDLADYSGDDTYFAASRLVGSVFWQSRFAGSFKNTLDFGVLAQIDLRNDDKEKLHSQYAVFKWSFPLFSAAEITAGGIFGIKEQDSGSAISFAGNLSAAMAVPGDLTDRISLAGFISSGSSGGDLRPYFPVTSISAGEIYTPSITGLYTAKLLYQVNPLDSLYVDLAGCYFWRTTGDIIPGVVGTSDSDADNLGAEVYATLVWSPVSDLAFSMEGGLFFPAGPVKAAETPILWKTKITATLSL